MTPLPKRRWSTRRQGKQAATHKARTLTAVKCPNCGALIVSHTTCAKCGFYNGKQVLKIKVKKTKQVEDKN